MSDRREDSPVLRYVRQHTYGSKAVLLLFALVVVSLLALLPMFTRMQNLTRELESKRKVLDELNEQVVVLNNLDQTILSERMKVMDKVLPPEKDVVAYVTALDSLSRDLGLSLGDISLNPGEIQKEGKEPPEGVKTQGLSGIETEVRVTGPLESIYALLRQVETTAPLMIVKDVALSRVAGEVFTMKLRLTMIYADPVKSGSLKGVVSLFTREEESLYEQVEKYRRYESASARVVSGEGKKDLFEFGVIDQDSENLESLPLDSEGLDASPSGSLPLEQ